MSGYSAPMLILTLLIACGAGTLRCDLDDASPGTMALTIDDVAWSGPLSWQLAGDSLQLNASEVDGQWVTAVGQETIDGDGAEAALDALPATFDLSSGGWAIVYTGSSSDRSASGTLEVQEDDGGRLLGCVAFETEAGTSVDGAFSAEAAR